VPERRSQVSRRRDIRQRRERSVDGGEIALQLGILLAEPCGVPETAADQLCRAGDARPQMIPSPLELAGAAWAARQRAAARSTGSRRTCMRGSVQRLAAARAWLPQSR
jgi:hypothetical protein